jgi:hypothetical protein
MYGEAEMYTTEPQFATNPEYYTPDGKKLTRCPDCDAAQVEWNQAYNRYDPQNLWVGRWMDPENGSYRYTYVDSDIRDFPRLHVHQQNAITDVQIPALRTMVTQLYNSDRLKDQMTAIALALLDQGRMRATELACLTPADVVIEGSLVSLGNRKIHADNKLLGALEVLKQNKAPDEPLFAVPQQKRDGEVDKTLQRRLGPNYFAAVLDQLGISLLGLQTYHGTLRFYQEMRRLLEHYQAPWDMAVNNALMSVALEWGHNFAQEMDVGYVMQLIQAVLIDPIVLDVLRRGAEEQGMIFELPTQELPTPTIPIPYVSMDVVDRNGEELEFSNWLHSVAVHEYAADPVAQQQPVV